MSELPTLPADDPDARELSAWLDGAAADPAQVARRLETDPEAVRTLERYRAVDRLVAGLRDPAVDEERQARLIGALVAPPRAIRRAPRLAIAAAVCGAATLVAFATYTRPTLSAPLAVASAPAIVEPPGAVGLDAALASPRVLRTPGWIRRLSLDPAARRELVERAVADEWLREEALAWWAVRPELLDQAELTRIAIRNPAGVALAERASAFLSTGEAAALTVAIGRSAGHGPALDRLLLATARRRGVAFADELVELARRSKILPAATAAIDAIGSAAVDAVARRIDRDPHVWTMLERSQTERAVDLLVRIAFGARGRWRAVRALEVRWTPALAPRLVALVADPELGVALAARIAATDEGAALLAARFLSTGNASSSEASVVALRALGRSGAVRATDELERLLGRPDLAAAACAALIEQDLPRSSEALARALAARRLDRGVFEGVLADYPAPRAVAMLALVCRERARAREVTQALLAAGDPRLLPVYGALLDHPTRAEDALRAVARCETAAATDKLIAALERPALKTRAHRFLVRRTGQNFAPDPAPWRAWRGETPAPCG